MLVALVGILVLAIPGTAWAGKTTDAVWPAAGMGSGTDQLRSNTGVAVDESSGFVYVADTGNNRVVRFAPDGSFERTWGGGVVASGPSNVPRDEVQQVRIRATGGAYTLTVAADGRPGFNERQTVSVQASGGTFQLRYGDAPNPFTAPIPFDASAATVQAALEALEAVGAGNVSVSGSVGGPWTVEFVGALAATNVPQLDGSGSGLSGSPKSVTVVTPTQTTAPIAHNAPAAALESALEALDYFDPADVSVSGPQTDLGVFDHVYAVGFAGGLTDVNLARLSLGAGGLTGPVPSASQVFDSRDGAAAPEVCVPADGDVCKAGVAGGAAGQFSGLDSVAVAPSSGDVYAGDAGNARIQAFDPLGGFERTWGRNVIAHGSPGDTPRPERQAIEQTPGRNPPTGGTFTVSFADEVTAPIAHDAPATGAGSVEAALEALVGIDPLDVTVTGAVGAWQVEFGGAFAAEDPPPLAVDDDGLTGTFVGIRARMLDFHDAVAEICATAADCGAGEASPEGAADLARGGEFGGSALKLAVDSLGRIYVIDTRISPSTTRVQRFSASGQFQRAWGEDVIESGKPGDLGKSPGGGQPGPFEICTVAADCKGGGKTGGAPGLLRNPSAIATGPAGVVYVVDSDPDRVHRFDSDGGGGVYFADAALGTAGLPAGADLAGVATDPSDGSVFVSTVAAGGERIIRQVSAAGALVDDHGVGAGLPDVRGLSYRDTGGRLYVSVSGLDFANVVVLDDDGGYEVGSATAPEVTDVGIESATFAGNVNPNGSASRYRFEVSDDGGASWAPVTSDTAVGSGTGDVAVGPVTVEGLQPTTSYLVRILVTTRFAGTAPGPTTAFSTLSILPLARTLTAAERTDASALLIGTVDPQGQQTTYRFDYGPSTSYGQAVPVPEASAGSGTAELMVAQRLEGLAPSTTYHYRIAATSVEGTAFGEDRTFTTEAAPRQGGPLGSRAYELVSPADKPTGPGVGVNTNNTKWDGASGVFAGAPSVHGDRYMSASVNGQQLAPDGESAYLTDVVLGERTPQGWLSRDLYNKPDYSDFIYVTFFPPGAVNDDLSLIEVARTGGGLSGQGALLFPEMADFTMPPRYVRDWDGDWRLVDPFDVGYADGWPDGVEPAAGVALGDDGAHVALSTRNLGTLGPEDPTQDQLAGSSAAAAIDLGGGISDSWADRGVTEYLGLCGGVGADRTRIPGVDASGDLYERQCPPPAGGRSAALVDPRGSSTSQPGTTSAVENLVSDDGRRFFFHSPDPNSSSVKAETGIEGVSCSGSDETTKCPPQLYVRQLQPDGSRTVRWLSRSEVEGQDAGLLGPAYYAGASRFGDVVFFQTPSPLTVDDPNDLGVAPPVGGVKTGVASGWDLYRYELPSGPEGRANGGDPAGGTLTRISAGPTGAGECAGPGSPDAMLRFVSDDGRRVYFTCTAALPGVAGDTSGSIATSGGAVGNPDTVNLYLYDASEPAARRWSFIARLPNRDTTDANANDLVRCVSAGAPSRTNLTPLRSGGEEIMHDRNCVRGTANGGLIVFWSKARLTFDDPDATSVDMYAFDADRDQLIRISAPQGGAGGTYTCVQERRVSDQVDGTQCYGDPGFSLSSEFASRLDVVAAKPENPADKIAYFQSRSRLVPEDEDTHYDVYEWRNGDLSLVSQGIEDTGAYYAGNGETGRDVFAITDARITWQDIDGVRDVYDVRVGGGIPRPPTPPSCEVLGGGCQGGAPPPPAAASPSTPAFSGEGNVQEPRRCPAGKVRKGSRCVSKARRGCGKRKGAAKRRCLRNQARRGRTR